MRTITRLTIDALKRIDKRNFGTRERLLSALRIFKESETEECKRFIQRVLNANQR